VIGGPLAGVILELDGWRGLEGWQWLFLLEGIPAVVLGRLMVVLSSNLWIGLYLASAAMTRRRQSLHDLALGSVVLRCKPADAERD
jgi:MFS family permease